MKQQDKDRIDIGSKEDIRICYYDKSGGYTSKVIKGEKINVGNMKVSEKNVELRFNISK